MHFIGSVVHIDEGLGNLAVQAPKLVIDGQQRLTTVTLLLTALADVLEELPEEQQEPIEGFAPAMIREYYLINPLQKGDKRFKLLLSDTDRATLMALVDPQRAAPPPEPSIRIQENHQFFLEQLRHPTTDLAVVCRGISKLLVVDVALSRDQDNPQLIFESMNSTGRELSQADLIRNFVLMGQPPELQERLYTLHWRPMELAFGQEAYSGNEFSAFMRDFLTLQTGEVPLLDRVYDTFKAYARRPEIEQAGTERLLQEVHAVAGRYCRIVLAKEPDPALHQAFLNLRELKVNVVNPLLLELYGDHEAGLLSHDEFLEALQLLESYVFRRAVCAIPSNSQQKTFATFSRSLRKENGHYLPSFKAHLLSLPSYRRFPSDEEFRREIQLRNLYKFNKSCSYWLRRLENHQRKEPIAVANYTIEHILPQNPELPAPWRQALGENWKALQEEWLHRLGNLTLTGYNPELSDRPFLEKRESRGRLRHQPAAAQRRSRPARILGRRPDPGAWRPPGRTGPGGVGRAVTAAGAAGGVLEPTCPPCSGLLPGRSPPAGHSPDPRSVRCPRSERSGRWIPTSTKTCSSTTSPTSARPTSSTSFPRPSACCSPSTCPTPSSMTPRGWLATWPACTAGAMARWSSGWRRSRRCPTPSA